MVVNYKSLVAILPPVRIAPAIGVRVDIQQNVAVRPGTAASGTGLDAEKVVH